MLKQALGAMAITAFALINAPVAPAEPLDRWHHQDQGSDSFDCAGLAVDVSWALDANGVFRAQGPEGLAYAVETIHGTIVFSNLANGKTFTHVLNNVIKDQQVTDNADDTLTITILGAGSDKFYGPDGKLLFNNPGQIRWQLLVPDNGTPTDPFDDGEAEFLGVIKGSTGRNDLQGRDFCEVLHEVIG